MGRQKQKMTNFRIPDLSHLERLGSASDFVEDIYEVVRVLAEFENFTASEYSLLCEYMDCFGTPSRATIITEGAVGNFLVIILTGQVDVVKADGAHGNRVVAHVGPGGILGEMSLIDGQRRFASCISTQPTDIAVLTREALNEILVIHPRLGVKLLLLLIQLTTSRLRDATRQMLPTLEGEWL